MNRRNKAHLGFKQRLVCRKYRMMENKKNVVYYFDQMISTYHYSFGHPMKPLRVAMTDEIVRKYKLDNHFETVGPEHVNLSEHFADQQKLCAFHSQQYIELIQTVTPENKTKLGDRLYQANFNSDCPVMERLYDYCLSYTSGSTVTAALLAEGKYTYGINWSGGLHHARQSQASGFCYINDCVLAILQLLKVYQRVLYVDIDIHHGDGVEQAFYLTDRVMTCSFHKFKDFPGTGHIDDIGREAGTYHAVNFPLDQGLDDQSFQMIFQPVISKIMENFRPDAIVLQSGADSLSGDRLGCFNLSVKGHGFAAEYLKKFNVPILFLGGGGYTLRNVARCWAYETSIICGQEIADEIPANEYSSYFGPHNKIHMPVSNMENRNSKDYLKTTTQQILKNLDKVNPSGVQLKVNGQQPLKLHASQVMRERQFLMETANIDRSTDKPE